MKRITAIIMLLIMLSVSIKPDLSSVDIEINPVVASVRNIHTDYSQLSPKERREDFYTYFNMICQYNPSLQYEKSELGIDFKGKEEFYLSKVNNSKNDFEFFSIMKGIVGDLTEYNEYMEYFLIDTFVPEFIDFINNDYVLRDDYRGNFRKKGINVYKSMEEFVPPYYELYRDTSYKFKYVTADQYVCINKDTALTNYTLLSINDAPISDFMYKELFAEKLHFDENNKLYRDYITLNELDGTPVKAKLMDSDGNIIEKDLYADIIAEMTYNYGYWFTRYPRNKFIYENKVNEPIYMQHYLDKENNYGYINLTDFENHKMDFMTYLNEVFDELRQTDNIIIDLRDNKSGNLKVMLEKFYPMINNKDADLSYVYKVDLDTMKNFGIRDGMQIRDSEKLVHLYDENGTRYVEYTLHADGNHELPDKNIYYLVDGGNTSYTEQYINLVKENNLGTVIGTRMGGNGMRNGSIGFTIPNTQLIFSTNVFEAQNPDGSSNNFFGTMPDIYCPANYDDFWKMVEIAKENKNIYEYENMLKYDTILKRAIEEVKKNNAKAL